MIKVPRTGPTTLCTSCARSVVIDNGTEARKIYCRALSDHWGPVQMEGPVYECSTYQNAKETSLYDMEKIAWIIEVSKSRPIGFLKPGTDEHRKALDL